MRCVECHAETETVPCVACGAEPRVGGRYALQQKVGGGASGVVFRSEDVTTGAVVAIKEVMLGGLASDKARELAVREARLLRQLSHPSIPAWRDEVLLGVGRSAALYLIQDFVDGPNLQAELADRRWSESEVLDLMDEVLDVLTYLHGLHPPVIHRDLKPANLIRASSGRLMVVDFGSVRDALRDNTFGGSTVAGTFGFMAPEQFAGHAVPASDLYAMGMTAVALLSRVPVSELHDRLGRLQWRGVVSVSPAMAELLDALLQADPHDRPASTTEARAHIARVRRGEVSPLAPPTAEPPTLRATQPPARTGPAVAIASALAAILALVATLAYFTVTVNDASGPVPVPPAAVAQVASSTPAPPRPHIPEDPALSQPSICTFGVEPEALANDPALESIDFEPRHWLLPKRPQWPEGVSGEVGTVHCLVDVYTGPGGDVGEVHVRGVRCAAPFREQTCATIGGWVSLGNGIDHPTTFNFSVDFEPPE